MKRILVTGASGFIGSHLAERLVRSGASVRVLLRDSASPGRLPILPEVECVTGDLRDADAVDRAVQGMEIVYHLGAQISVPYSLEHPLETAAINVQGTAHILEASRRHGIERCLITSTCDVYGTPRYAPVDEDHPLFGQSPYTASKIGAEALALSYQRSYGLPVVVARLFNTYGPRQSDRAVIPTIIRQALTHDQDAVRLGALHPQRDYTYVEDIVSGLMLTVSTPGAAGQVINLGSGAMIRIGALAELILTLVGRAVPIIANEPERTRAADTLWMQANHARATALLGWAPTVTLEAGLRRTIDWIKDHP